VGCELRQCFLTKEKQRNTK